MMRRMTARNTQKVVNDLYTTPVLGVISNLKQSNIQKDIIASYNFPLPLNKAIVLIPQNNKRWRLEIENLSAANIYFDFGRFADRLTSFVVGAGVVRVLEYPPKKQISFLDSDIGVIQTIRVLEAAR